MQEAEQAWERLLAQHGRAARGAVLASVVGVAPEDPDDVLTAELREARVNPRAAGGAQGGAGGPGMMPPMMMGGAGMGATGGAGRAGATGLGASAGAAEARGAVAAGASSTQPGIVSMPGLADARALPTTGVGAAGAGGGAGLGAGPAGAGAAGVLAAGAAAGDEAQASTKDLAPTTGEGEGSASGDGLAIGVAEADAPTGTPTTDGHSSSVGGARPPASEDTVSVDVERMRSAGGSWRLLSEEMSGATRQMLPPASLGFAEPARPDSEGLALTTLDCAQQAAAEFDAIAHRLVGAAGDYDDTEASNAAAAREAGAL